MSKRINDPVINFHQRVYDILRGFLTSAILTKMSFAGWTCAEAAESCAEAASKPLKGIVSILILNTPGSSFLSFTIFHPLGGAEVNSSWRVW
jgi:hypothetical protein